MQEVEVLGGVILTSEIFPRGYDAMRRENYAFFPFRSLAAFRVAMSPSANHRLALTSCTILMNCLRAMTGAEIPVITHGQKLSSLLARASSSAPALQGLAKRVEGMG
jgi:hypothetical protein